MRLLIAEVKVLIAKTYGVSIKDIEFSMKQEGVFTFPDPLPFTDELPEEGQAAVIKTGGEIYEELEREKREYKELCDALNELEDDHRGGRAWDIITSERIAQEKKVRELKNREYSY